MKTITSKLFVATLLFLVALTVTPAHAESLMFFSPLGVSSQGYTGPTSPVIVGTDGFRLSFQGNGSKVGLDPVLLILGVKQGSIAPLLSVSANSAGLTSTLIQGGPNVYNGTWDTVSGFAGVFDSGDPSAYHEVGLDKPGNASQNYTNWSGAGGGATSWNLYVYSLTFDPNFSQGAWVEIKGSLPTYTFLIGYGCGQLDASDNSDGNQRCSKPQGTPFTRTGSTITRVPEPSSILLLVPGLAFMVASRRRRK